MVEYNNRVDEVLNFWFGRVEETIVPTENRARVWFSEDPEIDVQVAAKFSKDIEAAAKGNYDEWQETARGQLALILLLDQFTRHIHRNDKKAFENDNRALSICLEGMEKDADHQLSLIERVFYYFPLLHAEKIIYQEQCIQAYSLLSELAFVETRVIYDSFLKFANHHYSIIRRFGRFPQRNDLLGRKSSEEETEYLREMDENEHDH